MKALLDQRIGLGHPMAALIEHSQFQLGVGDLASHGHHAFKALDGLLGAEDHPEALACQVEQLRVVRAQLCQAVEHHLRFGDLEPRAEGAARIHQSHQVLRIFAHRLFERT